MKVIIDCTYFRVGIFGIKSIKGSWTQIPQTIDIGTTKVIQILQIHILNLLKSYSTAKANSKPSYTCFRVFGALWQFLVLKWHKRWDKIYAKNITNLQLYMSHQMSFYSSVMVLQCLSYYSFSLLGEIKLIHENWAQVLWITGRYTFCWKNENIEVEKSNLKRWTVFRFAMSLISF